MNLVVDTSVVIAVITNEPKKPAFVARTDGATLLALDGGLIHGAKEPGIEVREVES